MQFILNLIRNKYLKMCKLIWSKRSLSLDLLKATFIFRKSQLISSFLLLSIFLLFFFVRILSHKFFLHVVWILRVWSGADCSNKHLIVFAARCVMHAFLYLVIGNGWTTFFSKHLILMVFILILNVSLDITDCVEPSTKISIH